MRRKMTRKTLFRCSAAILENHANVCSALLERSSGFWHEGLRFELGISGFRLRVWGLRDTGSQAFTFTLPDDSKF